MKKPEPPEGGWAPEGPLNPYIDGIPAMAWVSWKLQGAGFFEEDPLAGLLVEATAICRGGHYDRQFLLSMLPGAVEQAALLRAADTTDTEEGA